ncbi:hypothetical protein HHK36_004581 [Tetracentron sinense]|uniref:SnRK1-interacting protein 1 n=1 Tax=Tetracentron sinense TaxID=13715 RepID=A0A835DTK8_TETSI|nr:hypothetical protein HHK36_004581 [Tetracentron sinense]
MASSLMKSLVRASSRSPYFPLPELLLCNSSRSYAKSSASASASAAKDREREERMVLPEAEPNVSDIPTSGISRPLSEILKELNKRVPDSLIRARMEDGFSIKYIPCFPYVDKSHRERVRLKKTLTLDPNPEAGDEATMRDLVYIRSPAIREETSSALDNSEGHTRLIIVSMKVESFGFDGDDFPARPHLGDTKQFKACKSQDVSYSPPFVEWSGEVRSITYSADAKSVSVVYRVTLYGTDAEIYRESTGTASVADTSYGDPVQKAEAMAFRRACARLGLGLHLYHEDLL